MGRTLCSLHVYGGNREAIRAIIRDGDVVREENRPWFSVLPGQHGEDPGRFQKMAGKSEEPCVVFSYFDDMLFTAVLYLNGKKAAVISSQGDSSKIGLFEAVLSGNEKCLKALKALKRCADFEEQLKVLEESLGVALADAQDFEPRRVTQSSKTYDKIMAREAEMKKRPNWYRMRLVDHADWPEWVQKAQTFSEALCRQGHQHAVYDAMRMLRAYHTDQSGKIGMVSWRNAGGGQMEQVLYLLDLSNGRLHELPIGGKAHHVACMTGDGFPVLECFGADGVGIKVLLCLNEDGSERWAFRPALSPGQALRICSPAPEGEIMLLADDMQGRSAKIIRISREEGRMLKEKAFSEAEFVTHAAWMETLKSFALYSLGKNELLIYDENMEPVRRIPLGDKLLRFDYAAQYAGHLAIKSDLEQNLIIVNLITGEIRKIHLEIPAHSPRYMENGQIVAQSESGKTAVFFDETGKVVSRNRFKNPIQRIYEEKENVYVLTCLQYEDAIGRDVNTVIDSVEVWQAEAGR